MRLAALSLLACAAFSWPLPWLDRPGAAFLGLGLWAVASPLGGPRVRRPAAMNLPSPRRAPLGADAVTLSEAAQRVAGLDLAGDGRP